MTIRGDVHVLKPRRGARGHEQRGRRFGVVVQASDLSALSTVLVAPTSSGAAQSFLRPEVTIRGKRTRVLVPQFKAVDQARLGDRIERLDREELIEIDDVLRRVLELT